MSRVAIVVAMVAGLTGPAGLAGAATLTVTTTADSGTGSLRWAIEEANTLPGLDTIQFRIPGIGVQTIRPLSALPPVLDRLTIDGATRSGPRSIEIDGALAGPSAIGLELRGGPSVLRGLVVNGFGSAGIVLAGSGDHILSDSFVGTDAPGQTERPNFYGVLVRSSGNRIGVHGGNVISGNTWGGVEIGQGATGNRVENNLLGPNALGHDFRGGVIGQRMGLAIYGSRNTIRNNVIGGFIGIYLTGKSSENVVEANRIGLALDGGRLGQMWTGVDIDELSSGNTIGGIGGGRGNFIAILGPYGQQPTQGVLVTGGKGNRIRGNAFIGYASLQAEHLAIDLGPSGRTPNDAGDADKGANNLQNHPDLHFAVTDGHTTSVFGVLLSRPNGQYVIDVHWNPSCTVPGRGDAHAYLGAVTVTTDGSGYAPFSLSVATAVGYWAGIVATATSLSTPANDTSEMSPCVTAYPPS